MAGINISFFANIKKIVEKKAFSSINESLQVLKQEIDTNTPEDTGTLVSNNKIQQAKNEGTRIVGRIVNETPYAYWVEYGVGGKTYKYNKPKGRVFTIGIGARMYTKGFDNTRDFIIKKMRKDLG